MEDRTDHKLLSGVHLLVYTYAHTMYIFVCIFQDFSYDNFKEMHEINWMVLESLLKCVIQEMCPSACRD